jgi:6-phosphofructokinase 1
MHIGILTGGGDCPGLNAVIRAVCRGSFSRGSRVTGFRYGWRGLLEDTSIEILPPMLIDTITEGGTILRTSGDNPTHSPDGPQRVLDTFARHELDALVVIGGEGTMAGARLMWDEHNLPVIGVPKTIDNDLPGTDQTVGFDSALQSATDALDRLHTTAESHDRVMVCEVMGRTAGWLAMYAGVASGADLILIPEMDMSVEESAEIIQSRHNRGQDYSLVVVGEGYELRSSTGLFDDVEISQEVDAYGYPKMGGVSYHVANAIEKLTGFETRVTVLGHLQRGGTPSAADRALASRFGALAAKRVHEKSFGRLIALRGSEVVDVDLAESAGDARCVPPEYFEFVRAFMG